MTEVTNDDFNPVSKESAVAQIIQIGVPDENKLLST